MGYSTTGIIITNDKRHTINKKNLLQIISEEKRSIELSEKKRSIEFSDTKSNIYISNKRDSYIEKFKDFSILHNNILINSILFDDSDDYKRIYFALKKPTLMIIFCHYDSGGSYGYAIIENGNKIRSRVQIELETTKEFGEPLHFEKKWLGAERYYSEDPKDDGEYYTIPGDHSEFRQSEFFTLGLLNDCFNHYLHFNPIYDKKERKETSYRLAPKHKRTPPIDDVLTQWNWGAFLCNWVWAIYHRQWIGLLVLLPYLGLPIAVILGLKGNRWAWKSKSWENVNIFITHQKKWALTGLLFWITITAIVIMYSI